MNRLSRIALEHGEDATAIAERFGDHEGMSDARVLTWLAQFEDSHIPLALRILQRMKYYNTLNLKTLSRQLVHALLEDLPAEEYPTIALVPVGAAGSGAAIVARWAREAVRGTRIRLVQMLDLARAKKGDFNAIAFLDDFSGTGDTITDWWQGVEPLVLPLDARVVVSLIVLNYRARASLESFATRVIHVEELDEAADIFDVACAEFDDTEKGLLLEYSKKTGCDKKYLRGYGDCGLTISFRHGCPNNSIPALWYSNQKGWKGLFVRRTV